MDLREVVHVQDLPLAGRTIVVKFRIRFMGMREFGAEGDGQVECEANNEQKTEIDWFSKRFHVFML